MHHGRMPFSGITASCYKILLLWTDIDSVDALLSPSVKCSVGMKWIHGVSVPAYGRDGLEGGVGQAQEKRGEMVQPRPR